MRSFHAAKGAAQRVSSHRKEHRRRNDGQPDRVADALQPVSDSSAMPQHRHARLRLGEASYSPAWDGTFELSSDRPTHMGPDASRHTAFASISEAALVVRRGHVPQQHRQAQHAQLAQHHGSPRQHPASSPGQPAVSRAYAGLQPNDALSSRQHPRAEGAIGHADADASVGQQAASFRLDTDSPQNSDVASAARDQPFSSVTFRTGSATAPPFSATSRPVEPPSPAEAVQRDASCGPAVTSASEPAPSSRSGPWVDTSAALCASAVTSLLEGPLEMFRHRLQVSAPPSSAGSEQQPCTTFVHSV